MSFSDENESSFPREDVTQVVKQATTSVLEKQTFQQSKVNTWAQQILENALKGFQNLNKDMKFVVTVVLTQKAGAGLHTSSSSYWQPSTDGVVTYHYSNDQSQIDAIVTAYGVCF